MNNKRQSGVDGTPPLAVTDPTPSSASADDPTSGDQPRPRLFRRTDWLTFLLTFAAVWVVYLLTLGPEVTLEDSGELVTGSMYAGIPHAPGYPVWAIYSWLWTVLLPVGNMAWRVAMGQAFSGAVACGLLGMMVSRGSSMFIESIEALRTVARKWENAICVVSGLAAGALVGLDRFVWSESVVVNRIAIFSMPWIMLVLVCLMRWLFSPSQMRYAYLAAFLFGICITIHQSLVVAALAIEIFVAFGNPRMGRNAFLGNFALYAVYMTVYLVTRPHVHLLANISKPGMFVVFNIVGLGSLVAGVWLIVRTRELSKGWLPVVGMFALFWLGFAFYFYMPLSCMTNPPMEWCYPRTVDGFVHAITRGQYDQPNPTNVISQLPRFLKQLGALFNGLNHEFTWSLLLFALVPFVFITRMQKRERAWLIGLASMYICLGVLLTILLNPNLDQGSENLMRVFFTSSHTIVALMIGYGLALTAAFMAAHYKRFRPWAVLGGVVALALALWNLLTVTGQHYFGPAGHLSGLGDFLHWVGRAFAKDQYGLPIFGALVLAGLLAVLLASLGLRKERAPLALFLAAYAALPLYSGLSHWGLSEQRNHWFGYWFGHDMFTPPFKGTDGKPLYPEMERNAILFGGTDPGRFCPTYMIFCDSLTPHDCLPAQDPAFDRRDVYLITQNALVDEPYLNYIRAQYNRSAQKDPSFFTELFHTRAVGWMDQVFSWWGDKVEKKRRTYTSWFTDADFINLRGLAAKLLPGPAQGAVSKYIYDRLSPETTKLLSDTGHDAALSRSLATDLNRLLESGPIYDQARFETIPLSPYLKDFIRENPQGHTRIRLNRLLLEAAYPDALARSLSAIYPDREISTPTLQDRQAKIDEYLTDIRQRYVTHQLDPGEAVVEANGLLQVNNQVSIMAMNGLVAKVIFDKNPNNEFYVEESLPLKWMYPHLSPFGIIMRVNRQPLAEITEEMVQRDHEFWCQYSQRLIGNWITYDTSIEEIAKWIERVYLQHDFAGFKGDRKFIMDNQAQNAFSKLRSAIGGLYDWRLRSPAGQSPAAEQRMIKEADFAFRQAFAFSPTSPEGLSHLVSILGVQQRFADARRVIEVALKLDPSGANGFLQNIADQVDRWYYQDAFSKASQFTQARPPQPAQALVELDRVLNDPRADGAAFRTLMNAYSDLQAYTNCNATQRLQAAVERMQTAVKNNPADAQAVLALADGLRYLKDTKAADQALDALLFNRKADAAAILLLAQEYARLGNLPKTEAALVRHVKLQPDLPEARYDLAALEAVLGKSEEALKDLRQALQMNAEQRRTDPGAKNLFQEVQQDRRFDSLRQLPAFRILVTPPQPR